MSRRQYLDQCTSNLILAGIHGQPVRVRCQLPTLHLGNHRAEGTMGRHPWRLEWQNRRTLQDKAAWIENETAADVPNGPL